jgi:hypothetical protein
MISVNLKFLLSFLYLFSIYYFAKSPIIIKKIFFLLFLSMLVVSFISYLQYMEIVPYYYFTSSVVPGQMTGRASGGYSHPNDYMRFFLPLTVFYLVLNYYNLFQQKRTKRIILIGFLFMFPAVILTYHRMSFILIVIFIVIDLIYRRKRSLLLVLLGTCLYFIIRYSEYLYFFVVSSRLRTGDGIAGLFNDGRLYAFYSRVLGFKDAAFHNKLFGSGLYYGVEYGDNDFGRVLYSLGLFAFLFLVSYHLIYFCVIFIKRKKTDFYCLLISGIMFFFLSITTDPTRYPSLLLLYFLLVSAGFQSTFSRAGMAKRIRVSAQQNNPVKKGNA